MKTSLAKPVIITGTEEIIATAEKVPFGVEFEVSNRWFSLSFVTERAFFVQELGTQDPTAKFIKETQEKMKQWMIEQGLISENQLG